MSRFQNKIALITGGSSGIGAATARLLASEGATIVIADLQAELGRTIAAELGGGAMFHVLDVAREANWAALIDAVREAHDGIDITVHCAGIGGFGTIEDTGVEDWTQTMNVNALGTMLACRYSVAEMRRRGGGAIVNVGSTVGVRAVASQLAYGASKAAVLQISRATALHCAKQGYNIRCNTVLPGGVDTPLVDSLADRVGGRERLTEVIAATYPLGRLGRAEEVASLIAYLASDEASFITASAYAVDGGRLEV